MVAWGVIFADWLRMTKCEQSNKQELPGAALSELMLRAQRGDAEAYTELLELSSEMISSYLSRRINDKSAVEDVVQDVLLSIHRARHTFQVSQPFEPWLYAITKRRFIDYLRKSMSSGARELLAGDELIANQSSSTEINLGF